MGRYKIDIDKRFWSKVDKDGPNGCWIWLGATTERGYGVFKANGKNHYAHRMVLERKLKRKIKFNFQANHTCDNPSCVNPDHIYEGTHTQNMQDKITRKRCYRPPTGHKRTQGSKNGRAVVTEDIVLQIYWDNGTCKDLSIKYNVPKGVIYKIKSHQSWGWLTKHQIGG